MLAEYRISSRFRAGARVGAADLSVDDLNDIGLEEHVEYGFSPFGSFGLNWTPVGARPGSRGAAVEAVMEISAFATQSAGRIEGSVPGWDDDISYEAWPEVSSMWEGRLGALLAVQQPSSRLGFGLMYLESGAETRTRVKTRWGEDTLTDYFKTQNKIGMMFSCRLSPTANSCLNAEVIWTGPTVDLKISLAGTAAQ